MFYNKLLIGKDNSFNSAFNAFKINADADSSITNDNAILDANFQHLPVDFLDADLTMVAGAYGSGKICAYDSVGNIVDLGFSRNQQTFRTVKNNLGINSNNNPTLDNFLISNQTGYLLFDSIRTVGGMSDWSSGNGFVLNGTTLSSGVLTASISNSFHFIRKVNHNLRDNKYKYFNCIIKNISTIGRYVYLSLSQGASLWLGHSSGCVVVDLNTSQIVYTTPLMNFGSNSCRLIDLGNDTFFIEIKVKANNNGGEMGNIICLGFTDYVGVPNGGESNYTYNETTSTTKIEIIYIGGSDDKDKLNYFTTTSSYRDSEPDIVSPITLTNDAKIFIKTAKTSKLITLPSGTFNIHDYITNDKLICFTIKYI